MLQTGFFRAELGQKLADGKGGRGRRAFHYPYLGPNHTCVKGINGKTYAVFGDLDYEVWSRLTVQGGIRYTKQDRSFKGCTLDDGVRDSGFVSFATFNNALAGGIPGTPIPPFGCTTYNPATNSIGAFTDSFNEHNLSWRAAVNYKPDKDSLIYATISRGYKQGSFGNVGANTALQYAPAKQESVLAYEAGVKLGLLDHKLQINAAAFYYDYSDKQLRGKFFNPVIGGVFEALYNVPKSRVIGGEVQFVATPTHGLTLQGQVTYSDSKILSNFFNLSPLGAPVNFRGESFELTPKWSGNASIDYEAPINGNMVWFAGLDANYQGKQHGGYGHDPLFAIDSYTLFDVRIGIASSNKSWRASIWSRNLTNKYYWTNSSYLVDFAYRGAGMPRTFGVALQLRF